MGIHKLELDVELPENVEVSEGLKPVVTRMEATTSTRHLSYATIQVTIPLKEKELVGRAAINKVCKAGMVVCIAGEEYYVTQTDKDSWLCHSINIAPPASILDIKESDIEIMHYPKESK